MIARILKQSRIATMRADMVRHGSGRSPALSYAAAVLRGEAPISALSTYRVLLLPCLRVGGPVTVISTLVRGQAWFPWSSGHQTRNVATQHARPAAARF